MDSLNEKLVSWLFETKALKVCPQEKPFWYTSGSIGPYYVNTHFLYGSELKANELLDVINRVREDKAACPDHILALERKNYKSDDIYSQLIDQMVNFIKANIDVNEIDYISGGERRDWFFSIIVADLLQKPHITIFKDLSMVVDVNGEIKDAASLEGKKILHIADLITEASSYSRAWIPAIRSRGGQMCWSVVVVDRLQGGEAVLAKEGIQSFAMVSIDSKLFNRAMKLGLINSSQYEMITGFIENPRESMRQFLIEHPEFMKDALSSDEKTSERAQLCLERNYYNLDGI